MYLTNILGGKNDRRKIRVPVLPALTVIFLHYGAPQ